MADSDLNNSGVKAVITLGVLAFVGIVAVVVAKIVQYCVNKHYTDDGDGDVDLNTRELIRSRLSVVQFKKREIRKAKSQRTLSVFEKWKEVVKNRKKDRAEALKAKRPLGNGKDQVVINIEKTNVCNGIENGAFEKENVTIQENGSPRIPRFSFFTQGKKANGGPKLHTEISRIPPFMKTNSVKPEEAVPRGRPVSSKQRKNVTMTNVDINSTAKPQTKSVHFEKSIIDTEREIKATGTSGNKNSSGSKADEMNNKNNSEPVPVTSNVNKVVTDNGIKVVNNSNNSKVNENIGNTNKLVTKSGDKT